MIVPFAESVTVNVLALGTSITVYSPSVAAPEEGEVKSTVTASPIINPCTVSVIVTVVPERA